MKPQAGYVLFLCKGDLRLFYPKIAHALNTKSGWTVSAVAFSSSTAKDLETDRVFEHVFDLPKYLRKSYEALTPDASIARLTTFEKQFPSSLASTLHYGDRLLSRMPYGNSLRLLAGMCDFWTTAFHTCQPTAVFGELSTAFEHIGCLMAKAHGAQFLMPYITPVPGRFFLIGEPAGEWEAMRRYYEEHSGSAGVDLADADRFISDVRATRQKPEFMRWSTRSPLHFTPARALARFGRLGRRLSAWRTDGMFDVGSYNGTNPVVTIADDLGRLARHVIAERTAFEPVPWSSPYVYFPLHTQPEYTLEGRAPFLTNQLAVVEGIAKSLPAGFRLVVKDHPEMQGRRPLSFFRSIRALRNVALVSPSIDSHSIIEKAGAMVTISGTVAWESLVYGRPVIVLGNVPYGFVKSVRQCRQISDLPGVLAQALSAGAPSPDDARRMVAALLATAHRGSFDDPLRRPEILSPANVENIASGIEHEVSS